MLGIRLINPPPRGIYNFLSEREQQKVELAEPLGILYLAAFLREKGISVDVLDLNSYNKEGNKPTTVNEVVAECIRDSPQIIGIPTYTVMMPGIVELSQKIKENSDALIVHGGPHATFLDDYSLRHGFADFVIRKEGEVTLLELISAIEKGNNLKYIPGISFLDQAELIRNPDRKRIKDLDSLPFPARDLVSDEYFTQSRLNMITSRGCPSKCIYCVSPNFWDRRVTFRSVDNIDEELNHFFAMYSQLSDTFYINFVDDTFTLGGKKRNMEMANMLSQFGYDWHIFSRVDTVTPDVLERFYDSNCRVIRFGIEAGTERILNLFGKNQTLDKIRYTVQASKDAGLTTHGSFMICSPTETEDEVNRTIDFACSLLLDFAFFFITTPYPGTDMLERYVQQYSCSDFSQMDKFVHDVHFFGLHERLTGEQKEGLLEKAYFKFYIEKKGLKIPGGYDSLTSPMERVGLLQQVIMTDYYKKK